MSGFHEFVDPRSTPFVTPKYRGELPHLYKPGGTYFVTFRLADAIENVVVRASSLHSGCAEVDAGRRMPLDLELVATRSETRLDLGSCLLKRPEVAKIVKEALLFFNGQRYDLPAWCIMPNHVHLVVTPMGTYELPDILHSWKSFTSRQINNLLNTSGRIWERESFDHLCRSIEHVEWFINYTHENPVKAGLCNRPEEWSFSSAYSL